MTQPASPTALDRAMRAFRSLVASVFPTLLYYATWEFQVEEADGSTFSGSPTEQGLPLPSLVGVPYRCALAGTTCVPTPGTLAYVAFANGDPSKPILVAFGPCPPASGPQDAAPSAIRLDATVVTVGDPDLSPPFVVRVGDGGLGGTLSLSAGSQVLTYVAPGGGPPQLSPPGTISISTVATDGSSKLRSE